MTKSKETKIMEEEQVKEDDTVKYNHISMYQDFINFQSEVENIKETATAGGGSFSYNYAPLNVVLDKVRPLLNKYGFALIQEPVSKNDMVGVSTTLIHVSGESMEFGELLLRPLKTDPQGYGSAITYSRRYAISSLLGISSEEDDDASSISISNNKARPRRAKPNTNSTISKTTINQLVQASKEHNVSPDQMTDIIKAMFGKEKSTDLTESQGKELLERLVKIASEKEKKGDK